MIMFSTRSPANITRLTYSLRLDDLVSEGNNNRLMTARMREVVQHLAGEWSSSSAHNVVNLGSVGLVTMQGKSPTNWQNAILRGIFQLRTRRGVANFAMDFRDKAQERFHPTSEPGSKCDLADDSIPVVLIELNILPPHPTKVSLDLNLEGILLKISLHSRVAPS